MGQWHLSRNPNVVRESEGRKILAQVPGTAAGKSSGREMKLYRHVGPANRSGLCRLEGFFFFFLTIRIFILRILGNHYKILSRKCDMKGSLEWVHEGRLLLHRHEEPLPQGGMLWRTPLWSSSSPFCPKAVGSLWS